MKKLLYVAPHLSTGGLPQYLTKKIELLRDTFDIYVVEWSNHTGGVLVVQRDKITSMVARDKFFTLEENKMELINIINNLGYTPFALCVKNDHYKMASILLKYQVLLEYNWDGGYYDIRNNVIQFGSIEMKSVFQKHFKIKRHKNKSIIRKKQESKKHFDIYGQYAFYCSSFQDSLGLKGVITLAKHIGIKIEMKNYENKTELKKDLCNKISKYMVHMQLRKRLR